MQKETGPFRAAMSALPLLVQLPNLRPQGSFDQHVDLSEVRDESALNLIWIKKASVEAFAVLSGTLDV
jgi:hypothetical protein